MGEHAAHGLRDSRCLVLADARTARSLLLFALAALAEFGGAVTTFIDSNVEAGSSI
jgi:hypothetical protein